MYKSKNKSFIKIISSFALMCLIHIGCSEFLDVVPEGTGRLDNVFSSRETVLRYLYSNYSFLEQIDPLVGLEITGCGELWTFREPLYSYVSTEAFRIAEGFQTPFVNLFNRWDHYYQALHDCNILIEGLDTYRVPYLEDWEKDQWIAECKVLKAWYHFSLLRMYGPIPVIRENLPVSSGVEAVQVPREPVDVIVDYIVELLDEAIPYLPNIVRYSEDLGRINKPIALSIKAQVLVTAASPLFNCNTELAPLRNKDGLQLFPQDPQQEIEKWRKAERACEEALQLCINTLGYSMYIYPGHQTYSLTPTMIQQLTLRQAFCERWSSEVIWAHTREWVNLLQIRSARSIGTFSWYNNYGFFGPPLSIVEQFYSKNGIPISEDISWNYDTRYELRTSQVADNLYIREREVSAQMNFDREPRFYAWLAFDRGIYYGWGFENDANPANMLYYRCRYGEAQGSHTFSINNYEWSPTGYYPKKYIHYRSQGSGPSQMSVENYVWPLIRLPELMLFYAEAVNEANDTQDARTKAMNYLDMIRERAGLKSVSESWRNYSRYPDKFNTQNGLREIIRQERTNELVFEGKRYWDLRRWKTAPEVLNASVQGWDVGQRAPEFYYLPSTIAEQTFGLKDYFSPIPEYELLRNLNLVQNLGWN